MENTFSTNVDYLRKRDSLTQAKLATALGLKRNTVSNYITGHSQPNIETILKLASFFSISVDELLNVDLQNVHLNENNGDLKEKKNVHLNVHPNVHLNEDIEDFKVKNKAPLNTDNTAIKDRLIDGLQAHIDTLQAQVQFLQNQLENMKHDPQEKKETQYTPRQEAKSA